MATTPPISPGFTAPAAFLVACEDAAGAAEVLWDDDDVAEMEWLSAAEEAIIEAATEVEATSVGEGVLHR